MTFTAVRTWNRPHTKATITVYINGEILTTAGGKRAARAEAVLITESQTEYPVNRGPGLYGVRGDLAKAQVEARKLVTATEMKTRGRYGLPGSSIAITPKKMAVAVPVTEGE